MLTEGSSVGIPTDEPAAAIGASDVGGRSSRPGRRWLLLSCAVVLAMMAAGAALMSRRGDPGSDPVNSLARSEASRPSATVPSGAVPSAPTETSTPSTAAAAAVTDQATVPAAPDPTAGAATTAVPAGSEGVPAPPLRPVPGAEPSRAALDVPQSPGPPAADPTHSGH